jgi:hypothetical protein
VRIKAQDKISFPALYGNSWMMVWFRPGACMFANVLVMQIVPSRREGYRYVCVIIDFAAAASKTLWVFPWK